MVRTRKIISFFRGLWMVIGITLLAIILLEILLWAAFSLRDLSRRPSAENEFWKTQADTYQNAAWVKQYWDEFKASDLGRWEPYVYWRRKVFKGEYITIGEDGLRATPPLPTVMDEKKPVRIFVFGGSTVWGTGVRDGFTIPAILSKELHDRGIPANVVNFGESGYVSTQDILTLLIQIQKNNIPDIAIFYGGLNDVYSAYQHGSAGLPQNEDNRRKEFNLTKPEKSYEIKRLAAEGIMNGLSTVRLVKTVLKKINGRNPAGSPAQQLSVQESLTQEVIDVYTRNVKIVDAVADAHRFRYFFYWQPTIFEKHALTEYEQLAHERGRVPKDFYDQVYGMMDNENRHLEKEYAFRNLGAVFAETQEPVYIDWSHLGDKGNAVIVGEILKDVLPLIGRASRSTE